MVSSPAPGKTLEPVVGRIVDERLLAGSLGDPDVLSNRSPSTAPAVGSCRSAPAWASSSSTALHAVGVARERRRIEHGLVRGDDPRRRRVDDALAAARHEHHAVGVLGSHDSARVRSTGNAATGGGSAAPGECRVRPRRSAAARGSRGWAPRRRTRSGAPRPGVASTSAHEVPRTGRAIALVLQVGADVDLADPHESRRPGRATTARTSPPGGDGRAR